MPEPSKVIEGKLLALRIDRQSTAQFTKQCENLAEQLKNSYISEKYGKEKAIELAIEKTVETCRRQAGMETVKSVLASTKFNSPSEVVAKLICLFLTSSVSFRRSVNYLTFLSTYAFCDKSKKQNIDDILKKIKLTTLFKQLNEYKNIDKNE